MKNIEIPEHPAFNRALEKIARTEPTKVDSAKEIFDGLNQNQLVRNYSTYTTYDDKGNQIATIPYTYASTADLDISANRKYQSPDISSKLNKRKTSSELILDLRKDKNKLTIVLFPGFAPPPLGTPIDTERVERIIDIFGHASVQKQQSEMAGDTAPVVEIFSAGLAVGMGGRLSDSWPNRLREDRFSGHADVYANFVREIALKNANPNDTSVVLLGESMGCINGRETAKKVNNLNIPTSLYAKNPPGAPDGRESALLQKTQVILGYGGETGIRWAIHRFLLKDAEKKQDKDFFNKLSGFLERKNIFSDDQVQRRLKWKSTAIDAVNLLNEIPFSVNGIPNLENIIIDRGAIDPTSFTLKTFREWRTGKDKPKNGNIMEIWDRYAHTSQFNVSTWAHAISTIR
jgi:hypothetical protein